MPPPLSTHAVSEDHAPPAPLVTRSVPPTETTLASSAGHASLRFDQVEESPDAVKKFWPCGAMPSACVMSRVCSVSSQSRPARLSVQDVLVPSTESRVMGTLLVCPTFL